MVRFAIRAALNSHAKQEAEQRNPLQGMHASSNSIQRSAPLHTSRRQLVTLAIGCATAIALAGCSFLPMPLLAALNLSPERVRDAAAGEWCVLLVTTTTAAWSAKGESWIPLHVECDGGEIEKQPDGLAPGDVGEICVIPDKDAVGGEVIVRVTGSDPALCDTAVLDVTEPLSSRESFIRQARTVRDAFVPWLEAMHPELDITSRTTWTAVPIRSHRLVVTHCLFLSDAWEITVWWHVTTPPHDWARIALRRRGIEAKPSLAFQIGSLLNQTEPSSIPPPEELIR